MTWTEVSAAKENCGYTCDSSSCKETCVPNPPYKTFTDCTNHCKAKTKEPLWIILGVLGAIIVGVLIWIIVVHVKHTHRYKVGKVVNEMRVAQGGTTVAPTLDYGSYGSQVP